MKYILHILCLLAGLDVAAQFPQADIGNGTLHARIYLPDPTTGYYRSTRFDWSGVMPQLDYKGHHFFGQWFPKYDPTINDAIMGPVESFSPLCCGPGPSFVMIGIGKLSKPDDKPYSPFRYYPILDAGTWTVKQHASGIEFRHRLNNTYDYTKIITLVRDEMIIAHSLKNTGKDTIDTDVFDHNFFLPDSQAVAPGRVLKFPFQLMPEADRGLNDLAALRGDSIVILRRFGQKESVYSILHGYSDNASDYDIRLEDHVVGTGVHITCDRPLSRLVFWGNQQVLCPEPYIHIHIQPGETFTWTYHYTFYTLK